MRTWGTATELPSKGLSSLLEGLVLMRYTKLEGRIRRIVSVTKLRGSASDPALRRVFEGAPEASRPTRPRSSSPR